MIAYKFTEVHDYFNDYVITLEHKEKFTDIELKQILKEAAKSVNPHGTIQSFETVMKYLCDECGFVKKDYINVESYDFSSGDEFVVMSRKES